MEVAPVLTLHPGGWGWGVGRGGGDGGVGVERGVIMRGLVHVLCDVSEVVYTFLGKAVPT